MGGFVDGDAGMPSLIGQQRGLDEEDGGEAGSGEIRVADYSGEPAGDALFLSTRR